MADTFATSFGVLNYSGMLFNKGNVRTPLSSIIGSKAKTTNHVEFVTGQEYTSNGNGSQPAISESASLTAPDADVVTRSQKTNVTQIFQESVGISYGKQSNMGTNCPIDENTLLFVDKEPEFGNDGNPLCDYRVRRVAKSLNSISYAISKVTVS